MALINKGQLGLFDGEKLAARVAYFAGRLMEAKTVEERGEIEGELSALGVPPQQIGPAYWNGRVLVEDSDLVF